ncbi:MAG TPA: hypothetical protein VF669_21745 [Tepidisphaeraceae bacterium]
MPRKMLKDLIVLGASGNVWDVLDVVDAINALRPTWNVVGVLDDRRPVGSVFAGAKVVGTTREAARFSDASFINAIRSEKTVSGMEEILGATGVSDSQFATLVHPLASVSSRAKVGRDVLVNFGASVAGNVTIEDHVSLGPNAVVGHDTCVDRYSAVAAGAILSGGVQVERGCYIGTGATVKQQIRIGAGAIVGMGAVVTKDIEAGAVVVGNPARPMVRRARMIV